MGMGPDANERFLQNLFRKFAAAQNAVGNGQQSSRFLIKDSSES
jgi:hypothetical protein